MSPQMNAAIDAMDNAGILDATVGFLAEKHGTTPAAMLAEITGGNMKLRGQFAELLATAMVAIAQAGSAK